mmetsp:Transcript_3635/g.6884  ORF Transcript_3635/g.6884 Transcript_3635/m.6884 type:complete len:331 (-) Transcript_3635:139-1131(-)
MAPSMPFLLAAVPPYSRQLQGEKAQRTYGSNCSEIACLLDHGVPRVTLPAVSFSVHMVLLVEPAQVSLEHFYSHLPDHGDVLDTVDLQELVGVDVLEGSHVDNDSVLLYPLSGELIRLDRDASNDDVTNLHDRLDSRTLVAPPQTSRLELVYAVHIARVDRGAVIREHGRERAAHDLRAVYYRAGLALQAVVDAGGLRVYRAVLQDLHAGQRGARQDALAVRVAIEVTDVLVQGRAVGEGQALDVFLDGYAVAEVVVVAGPRVARCEAEDGIVHDDAVDVWVIVALGEGLLDVLLLYLADLVAKAVFFEGLFGPVCVALGRRIRRGEETD